jgi:hypothetical protein
MCMLHVQTVVASAAAHLDERQLNVRAAACESVRTQDVDTATPLYEHQVEQPVVHARPGGEGHLA